MAVVQISRIQIRRGQAGGGTGIPQLASGELAWALDTQEMFIGNGSISEGAPYVGNTKILTEHDNILELVSVYQYKKNDTAIITGEGDVVRRSLQDRLDDIVSVKAFGAAGDGFVDDTAAIQRAIDQLYINEHSSGDPSSRIVLYFEAGTYIISDELKIPPYAHLIGDGIDSTIIQQVSTDPNGAAVLRTVDGSSTPGSYTAFGNMSYLKRPRYIRVADMTLQNTTTRSVMISDNMDSSVFDRVKFLGAFVNGTDPVTTSAQNINDLQSGIYFRSNGPVFCNNNILLKSCIFNATGYGVYSASELNYITFEGCTFFQLFDGITVGGGISGAIGCAINSNYFDQIDRYGIWIKAGSSLDSSRGNTTTANKFFIVGNNNNSYSNAEYPIIKFDQPNNLSTDDYFERNTKLKNETLYGLNPFIPNVQTQGLISENFNYTVDIIETGDLTLIPAPPPVPLMRFPVADSATYEIDYVLNKFAGDVGGKAVRTGKLHITVNIGTNLTDGLNPPSHQLEDHFGYTGDSSVEDIKFLVSLYGYIDGTDMVDTMIISYTNPLYNGSGTLNYTYRMLTK
jgi:Pectate lyase superfamily protein